MYNPDLGCGHFKYKRDLGLPKQNVITSFKNLKQFLLVNTIMFLFFIDVVPLEEVTSEVTMECHHF